jgi:hypothetical protein
MNLEELSSEDRTRIFKALSSYQRECQSAAREYKREGGDVGSNFYSKESKEIEKLIKKIYTNE